MLQPLLQVGTTTTLNVMSGIKFSCKSKNAIVEVIINLEHFFS